MSIKKTIFTARNHWLFSLCIRTLRIIFPLILAGMLFLTDIWYLESGSMAPQYPAGSIVLTTKLLKPRPDAICAYRHNGIIVIHRIIAETDEGYIFKGDANNTMDPLPVAKDWIEGVLVLGISPLR